MKAHTASIGSITARDRSARHTTRLITVALTTAGLTAAGLTALAPAQAGTTGPTGPTASAGSAIPRACTALVTFSSRGYFVPSRFTGSTGETTVINNQPGALPSAPMAQVVRSVTEERTRDIYRGYAVTKDGVMHRVTWVLPTTGSYPRATTYQTVVGRGYGDVTSLATSGSRVYAVAGTQLREYRISSSGGLGAPRVLSDRLGGVKTLSYERSTAWGDILVASTKGGQLWQVKTSRATSTARASVVPSGGLGLAGFPALSAYHCPGGATGLVGISKGGILYTFFDADGWSGPAKTVRTADPRYRTNAIPAYSN